MAKYKDVIVSLCWNLNYDRRWDNNKKELRKIVRKLMKKEIRDILK